MITYKNYHPIAYYDEQFVPVPGWGMQPLLAGNPVIAIGGLGLDIPIKTPLGTQNVSIAIEPIANAVVAAAWPALQQKIEAEVIPRMRTEISAAGKEAKQTSYVLGAVVVAAIFASAWWVKKGK